jgi:hypothetical protein
MYGLVENARFDHDITQQFISHSKIKDRNSPTHAYAAGLPVGHMAPIRRLVLDVLKSHEPTMLSIAQQVAGIEGVSGVNTMLLAMDEKARNIKFTIEGDDIDYEAVTKVVEDAAGSVHSIDQVACGEKIIEDKPTPQD